jgi:GNAT superfamily N-acetyltransferase
VLADYSPGAMQRRLGRAAIFLVAITGEGAVGGVVCASWAMQPGTGRTLTIESLFVDPSVQGMGIGSAMMDAVYALAEPLSVQTVTVASSLTAVGFYARVGFSRNRRSTSRTGVETVVMDRVMG